MKQMHSVNKQQKTFYSKLSQMPSIILKKGLRREQEVALTHIRFKQANKNVRAQKKAWFLYD